MRRHSRNDGGRSLGPEERSFPASRGRVVLADRPAVMPFRSFAHYDTGDHYMTLWLLMYNGRLAHARTFSGKTEIRGREAPRVTVGLPRRKRLASPGGGG